MNERAYNTNEIIDLTIENGGGTWLRLGRGGFCNPETDARYVVAQYDGDGLVIPNFMSQPVDFVTHLIEWFANQIYQVENLYSGYYTQNGYSQDFLHNAHFGTWIRGDDLVLDIVQVIEDDEDAREYALELAKGRNQDAIFDLVEMKEVFVTEE